MEHEASFLFNFAHFSFGRTFILPQPFRLDSPRIITVLKSVQTDSSSSQSRSFRFPRYCVQPINTYAIGLTFFSNLLIFPQILFLPASESPLYSIINCHISIFIPWDSPFLSEFSFLIAIAEIANGSCSCSSSRMYPV
jgi:hypothetical protein